MEKIECYIGEYKAHFDSDKSRVSLPKRIMDFYNKRNGNEPERLFGLLEPARDDLMVFSLYEEPKEGSNVIKVSKNGRIRVPIYDREELRLENQVVFTGAFDHVLLWNPEDHKAFFENYDQVLQSYFSE
jgi:DNA-binding transcriptional regulator/RsmH inhibitor MraZ